MDLIYKILFEVKLLHEFFLTDESGASIFNAANATGRETFLENAFMNDNDTINRDISFEFPDDLKDVYKGYHLKIIPSYSGCKVFVRVNKILAADNSVHYQPFIPLPDDLNIFIVAVKNNSLINTYSNSRISKSIPSIYLFSNDNIPDSKTFPYLVNNIAADKPGYEYEQGELVLNSANKVVEYYYDNSGALIKTNEIAATGVQSFANENDRLLVPLKFNYTFIGATVKQATFELKDGSGNTIKSISVNQSQPVTTTTLDFSDKESVLNFPGIFSLQVSGDNNFSETNNVIFSNSLFSNNNWAVVHIKTKVSNADFNILTDDGFLKSQEIPVAGAVELPAVFLVQIKSRFGYFRYSNDVGSALELSPDPNTYFFKEGKQLITQVPVSIANYFFKVPDVLPPNQPVTLKYFPNPVSYSIQKDEQNRICFDVVVPQSDLFPVGSS
jgi:hypothetical protein